MLLKMEISSTKIHNALQEDLQMVEATSCGGVVIYRGKILTLYKSYKNRYEGWVLPKGTVEEGEEYHETVTTSTLQQQGSLKLRFSARHTMALAQALYQHLAIHADHVDFVVPHIGVAGVNQ